MSWVLLSLRKSELQQLHSQYVVEELQISRQQRQDARHYQYQQIVLQNDQSKEKNEKNSSYRSARDDIRKSIKELYAELSECNAASKEGNEYRDIYDNLKDKDSINAEITELQNQLSDLKENHEAEMNDIATYYEDELAMIEEDSADTETQHEQDKVRVETQMEAVAQELQAISQSISQQIQNETIKIS